MTEPAATATTEELGELTLTRVYDAPRELVWACMTTPEHLTHFWGGPGCSTPLDQIVVELRVGGRFITDMVNDETGEVYPNRGVFTVVEPIDVLAWTEPDVAGGMTTTSRFIDLGDGRTEVVMHQTNVPPMYRSPEAQAGMQVAFDKFAAYLATKAA
jgi:uncharacterized protein YndB with AHSA1/START domain